MANSLVTISLPPAASGVVRVMVRKVLRSMGLVSGAVEVTVSRAVALEGLVMVKFERFTPRLLIATVVWLALEHEGVEVGLHQWANWPVNETGTSAPGVLLAGDICMVAVWPYTVTVAFRIWPPVETCRSWPPMVALAGTVMFSVSEVGLLTVMRSTENNTSGWVASTALVSPCTQLVLLPTTCSTCEKPCGNVLGVTDTMWAEDGATLKLKGKSVPPEVRMT